MTRLELNELCSDHMVQNDEIDKHIVQTALFSLQHSC